MRHTQPDPMASHPTGRPVLPPGPVSGEQARALLSWLSERQERARRAQPVPGRALRNRDWMALPGGSVSHAVHLRRADRRTLCGLVRDADQWQSPGPGPERCYSCVARAEYEAGF